MAKKEFPLSEILKDDYDYVIHMEDPEKQLPILKEYLEENRTLYEGYINPISTINRIITNIKFTPSQKDFGFRLKGGKYGTFSLYSRDAHTQLLDFGHILKFLEFEDYNFEGIEKIQLTIPTNNLCF